MDSDISEQDPCLVEQGRTVLVAAGQIVVFLVVRVSLLEPVDNYGWITGHLGRAGISDLKDPLCIVVTKRSVV